MKASFPPSPRRFLTTVLLGAGSGALFLGVGGRLVMWLFALATSRPPAFTLRGTLGVTLAGAIAGVIGSFFLMALRRFLPVRAALRGLAFAILCYLLAIPGFRPPVPLVFALFAPVFLAYGVVLVTVEARLARAAAPLPS
ncbi:MAG TPA: hypothetical protein VF970_01060 [Gemmatimonadales bacterium]